MANSAKDSSWVMDFRRSLSIQEYDSWLELGESLQGCNPQSDEADAVILGGPSKVAGVLWKSRIPLKIKFFLWQVVPYQITGGKGT